MALSPAGPNYAGTAADGGGGAGLWTNPSNATGPDDGVFASGDIFTPGEHTNALKLTNFGFALPATAIIDGILVEYDRSGTACEVSYLQLIKAGTQAGTPKADTVNDIWPSSEAYFSYGGPIDLWGTTLTPSDINNSGFGVAIAAQNTSGGGTAGIDAVRITVYWHSAPANVPKRYIYQIFDSTGTYLGLLPEVVSDFQVSYEINSAGTNITIKCAVSADTSLLSVNSLTDESGNTLTDEAGNTLTNDGATPVVAPGNFTTGAIIKNGNKIKVYESGYWNPNGKCVFIGQMQRWEADFGGEGGEDSITVYCYSDGRDLDNYIMRGTPYTYTLDQSQTSHNTTDPIYHNPPPQGALQFDGQTWTVGAGISNLGAISLLLGNGNARVTVSVYTDSSAGMLLGSATQDVFVSAATEVQFAFPTSIPVQAGNSYFFTVSVNSGQNINIYYSTANPYANGAMYNLDFSGGGGGGWVIASTWDLYFKTFSGTGSTTGTFTAQDPTTGMLSTIMSDYTARGGLISSNSSTIQATGLSLTYGYNTNTVLEGIQAIMSMCPSGFYWYVDLGTNMLYFLQSNTTADIVLTKGKHLDGFTLVTTIENTKNQAFFTGGQVSGVNLYVQYSDPTSISLYGPCLDRPSNNHITDSATARQIAQGDIIVQKDEQYATVVKVVDRTMDTTLLKPGLVIGFNGFGTFADSLLMQIVRIAYTPEEVTLTLGRLPKRLHPTLEALIRNLAAQQTIANPSSPS